MAITLNNVLSPSYIRGLFARVKTPGNRISKWLGMNIGGANNMPITEAISAFTYDIFDPDRGPATMTVKGRPATRAPRKSIGFNTVAFAQSYEADEIQLEDLIGTRQIGGQVTEITRQGDRYLELMAKRMKQRQENLREMIVGSLFRGGKYYLKGNGDDLTPSFDNTSGNVVATVDLKFNPGSVNLYTGAFASGLQMGGGVDLITAAWSDPNTKIVTQLSNVNKAFERLYGAPLEYVCINSAMWSAVRNNLEVRNIAGSANAPATWKKISESVGEDGKNAMTIGVIDAIPWLQWVVYDGGLEGDTGWQLAFPDDTATFMAERDDDAMQMCEGTWGWKQYDHTPLNFATGFEAYSAERANPAVIDFFAGQKVAIALYSPKFIATSRVN